MHTPLQLQKLPGGHVAVAAVGAVVMLTLSTAKEANVDVLSVSKASLPGCRCLRPKVPGHPEVEKHVEA